MAVAVATTHSQPLLCLHIAVPSGLSHFFLFSHSLLCFIQPVSFSSHWHFNGVAHMWVFLLTLFDYIFLWKTLQPMCKKWIPQLLDDLQHRHTLTNWPFTASKFLASGFIENLVCYRICQLSAAEHCTGWILPLRFRDVCLSYHWEIRLVWQRCPAVNQAKVQRCWRTDGGSSALISQWWGQDGRQGGCASHVWWVHVMNNTPHSSHTCATPTFPTIQLNNSHHRVIYPQIVFSFYGFTVENWPGYGVFILLWVLTNNSNSNLDKQILYRRIHTGTFAGTDLSFQHNGSFNDSMDIVCRSKVSIAQPQLVNAGSHTSSLVKLCKDKLLQGISNESLFINSHMESIDQQMEHIVPTCCSHADWLTRMDQTTGTAYHLLSASHLPPHTGFLSYWFLLPHIPSIYVSSSSFTNHIGISSFFLNILIECTLNPYT